MTVVKWKSGHPNNGTKFDFMKELDTALVYYLKNYAGDLSTFLTTINAVGPPARGVTFLTHVPDTAFMGYTEAAYPLAAVYSWGASIDPGVASRMLGIRGRTRIRVWAKGDSVNITNMADQCSAVTFAIMSALHQLPFIATANELRDSYWNGRQPPEMEASLPLVGEFKFSNEEGSEPEVAATQTLDIVWSHQETAD